MRFSIISVFALAAGVISALPLVPPRSGNGRNMIDDNLPPGMPDSFPKEMEYRVKMDGEHRYKGDGKGPTPEQKECARECLAERQGQQACEDPIVCEIPWPDRMGCYHGCYGSA